MPDNEPIKDMDGEPQEISERFTVLDDRLLQMTREEAKAELDRYIRTRGLDSE
jgi:hypothetical protein